MLKNVSPSLGISLLALFIALGGAGYSATGGYFILGERNSASTQTRLVTPLSAPAFRVDNASSEAGASGVRVVTHASRPPFVVSSKARVANLNADLIDGLNSTAFVRKAIEGWRYVGDPGEPAFENGWSNVDPAVSHAAAESQHLAFRIDNNRVVHIRGNVKAAAPTGFVIFTLPPAYRPNFHKTFAVSLGGPATTNVFVAKTGGVESTSVAATAFLALEGVSYPNAASDALVASGP